MIIVLIVLTIKNVMVNKMSLIYKATQFAINKHDGQLDDEGKDYFNTHVFPVSEIVKQITQDEEIIATALLHDCVEDTDATYEELVKEFGIRVANLVNELTHEGSKDDYGYYFPRLKSKEAIMIKMIDRAQNLSRMGAWSEERQQHYLDKSKFWKDGKDKN